MSVHDEIDEYLDELKEEISGRLANIDINDLVYKMAAQEIKMAIDNVAQSVNNELAKMRRNIDALQKIWASDENKATYNMIKRLDLMNIRIAKLEESKTFLMSMIDNKISHEKN